MKPLKFKPYLLNNFYVLLIIGALVGCNKPSKHIEVSPELFHKSVDKVTEIIVHDIFSPPVASRIFAYPNIAAYEILAQKSKKYKSLYGIIKEYTPIPKADTTKQINLELSALIAHMELSKSLIFSEDRMAELQDSLYAVWKDTNEEEFNQSKDYAMKVVDHITTWMNNDNYPQTRTMPKFTVDIDDPSRWQPTPPAYMDGIEPHWNEIRTFVMDSASQFKPQPHPKFSLDKDSEFYKQILEVYDTRNEMGKDPNAAEKEEIAQFWDCNPFASVVKGHFMFAKKKISPGAHWLGIVKIVTRKAKCNFEETVNAYTKTSIALADGFISAWDEKYRTNLIRPETLINKYIDPEWTPLLQTPPFPEYTSAHSVVSGAASVVLTRIFGDNFYFDDDTELQYGLPIRSFHSFYQASAEAAISRMYGGIHYRAAIENGLVQGKALGNFIADKMGL